MEPHVALVALGVGLALVVLVLLVVGLRRRRAVAKQAPPEVAAPAEKVPESSAQRLRAALGRTRAVLAQALKGQVRGGFDDGQFARLEEALLLADVGVQTTISLLTRLKREVGSAAPGEGVVLEHLRRLLLDAFTHRSPGQQDSASHQGPWVILITGVNGVGKTTTIGKLAARYGKEGKQVLVIAADTFRAAATEQLERWAARTGAAVVSQGTGADPAAVVVDGLRSANARRSDVVIVDTAGRLHTKSNLMEELRKIRRVAERECPGAPHETLLVLDASTGQNGLQQARLFQEAVAISGIVLTKLDGTARGGIAVAVAVELGVPIRFIGIGEGVDDLRPFEAEEFVDALLLPETEGSPLIRSG
jgi:fused signal recognition particle receptor